MSNAKVAREASADVAATNAALSAKGGVSSRPVCSVWVKQNT